MVACWKTGRSKWRQSHTQPTRLVSELTTLVQRRMQQQQRVILIVMLVLVVGWRWIDDQVMAWLVEAGGYGLSNAVTGAVAAGLSVLVLGVTGRQHRLLETDPGPETLGDPRSFTPGAKRMRLMMWVLGAGTWALPILLISRGDYATLLPWPLFGATLVVLGYLEVAHARIMDDRRGSSPAPAGQA